MRSSRVLISFLLIFSFFIGVNPRTAGAQQKTPPAEPEFREATLKLGGTSCDVNQAESALLRLKGVVEVDVGKREGHLVVAYDPQEVSPPMMLQAVAKKKGCTVTVVGIRPQ